VFSDLYFNIAVLYMTRCRTGSQCSRFKIGVMWLCFLVEVTILASEFWTRWSLAKLVSDIIIIIIDNRGLNARWYLTPLLLSLPTAAYLGQRGLTPAGLPHTIAQCHLTILGEAVLFCLNHPSFRTPGSLSFCCRSFCRYGRRGATFSVSLSAVGFLSIESFCTILH